MIRSGLVKVNMEMLAQGKAHRSSVYSVDFSSPRTRNLASGLGSVVLPDPAQPRPAKFVPYYLRHLFWNTAPRQLSVETSADYIARRLLTSGDPDGLAWGASHLPHHAWAIAARSRGLSPQDRALADNLARARA
jgi:hypothetical protein